MITTMLTTGTDDTSLAGAQTIIKSVRSSVPVVTRWLRPGNRTFFEVASMVVTCWIVAVLCSDCHKSFTEHGL